MGNLDRSGKDRSSTVRLAVTEALWQSNQLAASGVHVPIRYVKPIWHRPAFHLPLTALETYVPHFLRTNPREPTLANRGTGNSNPGWSHLGADALICHRLAPGAKRSAFAYPG
jgi:hypothetical protein